MKNNPGSSTKSLLALTLLAMVLSVATSSCKRLLDTNPQGAYDESTYPFPGGTSPYDEYIFGAYRDLRLFDVHVWGYLHAISIRSDDADKGSTPADGGANSQQMDNFPVLPNNGLVNALWTGHFGLINRCNNVLFQVANNKGIIATEAQRTLAIAEARFLRGYAYFNMVRFFGNVPIFDSLFQDPAAQNNVPQSTPDQLYAFIENDLTFAAANLPPDWPREFIGRVTNGAALGMLAKVYLYQRKWTQAQSTALQIMNSGRYNLNTPYGVIFTEAGENSSESIFEIQATATATQPTINGIQYANVQAVRGAGIWNYGWGFNTPSEQLAAAYETGDPRRARTILFTSTSTTPGVTFNGETTPVGLPNPRYNHKVHPSTSFVNVINNRGAWWMNVRILRYADVVLMYAEASNEIGGDANITAARNAVNSVRARARGGNNAVLPNITFTTQADMRQAIRQERRVELAMEHERFFDIVRWGISDAVMQAAGKPNYSESRDKWLPIPQVQIDLTRGVLRQNPGY
ncbi:MAG: RagB/SusD family nutrient uptake outer membrane protein [Chitinophagaceae bacterium]|nr:RagB/SusD family nutrient uptake outer membrane protein [Chitinophagaceae bacterium]